MGEMAEEKETKDVEDREQFPPALDGGYVHVRSKDCYIFLKCAKEGVIFFTLYLFNMIL